MWANFAKFVIKYRLPFLILLFTLTGFMAYQSRKVELSYNFAKLVPADDPAMIYFQNFLKTFGEDGNLIVIGFKDSTVYQLEKFKKLDQLCKEIAGIDGVDEILSLCNLKYIHKNEDERKFEYRLLFPNLPKSQFQLDSTLQFARTLKLYEGQIWNTQNGAMMVAIAINPDYFKNVKREALLNSIIRKVEKFTEATQIEVHYSGVPYIRTVTAQNIKQELSIFLVLSLSITVIVLFLFFRSFQPVIFPLIMIGMIIFWTLGTLGILGFKMTILTGLLPPILVVIGIPNSVYLLTKFHQECIKSGDKIKAMVRVISKLGVVTLITNTTTAIGFVALTTAQISILQEFGLVAAINIIATFLISIIYLPAVFSYLPLPSEKQLAHLDLGFIKQILANIVQIVSLHRTKVYAIAVSLAIVSVLGLWRIKAVSYMVDDLPDASKVIQDLRFLEENFKGVMPLEIVVDTGKPKSTRRIEVLSKLDSFQRYLQDIPSVSPALSVVTFLKAAKQSYFDQNPSDFQLPTRNELAFIQRYIPKQGEIDNLTKAFVDTSGQYIRISLKVADLGSVKMDSLIDNHIAPQASQIFDEAGMKAHVTGTTLMFVKGNDYLITNLKQSLLLAIVVIGGIIAVLFKNIRIMLISISTNMLPLLITAGLMGYLGVPLKPSTALIFSITFGIAVDDSIHYLARYRQALAIHQTNVFEAVETAIKETGVSMIYTSLVLFAGFIIFTVSEFGGTVALGALTSTTLLIAMLTSLILLPSLLITFDNGKQQIEQNDWSEEV
jgi:predicted RND superfamily exporter protein